MISFYKNERADDVNDSDGDILLFSMDYIGREGKHFEFDITRHFFGASARMRESGNSRSRLSFRLTSYSGSWSG